jgi:hypothetical protein
MHQTLLTRLSLDSDGNDGPSSEVTQPVSMAGMEPNAVQWDATHYVLTATNVSYQLQVSNDLENWADKGSAQTHDGVGYKLFTTDTAVAAAYVRLQLTITGSGKAVVAAGITLSNQ